VVVAAEAVLALGVAVWQVIGVAQGGAARPEVAWGSSAYFLLLAVIIGALAFAAGRGMRWVYGPVVFLQVLALPMAAMMATAGLWVGAVLLGATACAGLVLLLGEDGRTEYGRSGTGP
jgi:hypothetical protein